MTLVEKLYLHYLHQVQRYSLRSNPLIRGLLESTYQVRNYGYQTIESCHSYNVFCNH